MYPPFRFHKHECRPTGTPVLCAERPAADGRDARRKGIQRGNGVAVSRPALAEKRERHTAGGRIADDGKDRMAPLIESDENRELYRALVQEIKEIISKDVAETAAG